MRFIKNLLASIGEDDSSYEQRTRRIHRRRRLITQLKPSSPQTEKTISHRCVIRSEGHSVEHPCPQKIFTYASEVFLICRCGYDVGNPSIHIVLKICTTLMSSLESFFCSIPGIMAPFIGIQVSVEETLIDYICYDLTRCSNRKINIKSDMWSMLLKKLQGERVAGERSFFSWISCS